VLICSERKVLLTRCWWLIRCGRKVWLISRRAHTFASPLAHDGRLPGAQFSEKMDEDEGTRDGAAGACPRGWRLAVLACQQSCAAELPRGDRSREARARWCSRGGRSSCAAAGGDPAAVRALHPAADPLRRELPRRRTRPRRRSPTTARRGGQRAAALGREGGGRQGRYFAFAEIEVFGLETHLLCISQIPGMGCSFRYFR
jgi:hypothetical protein